VCENPDTLRNFVQTKSETSQTRRSLQTTKGLIRARELLSALFEESSRPSIRWLHYQMQARNIPYYKIGSLVFFDLAAVREALNKSNKVEARHP
jgi:hypothetical protein